MALNECVDCGKGLSPTAQTCGGCNSIDPFGRKRADDKLKSILMMIGIAVVAVIWLAFHFDFLTFAMVKNFLHPRPN